jgi:protein MAK11
VYIETLIEGEVVRFSTTGNLIVVQTGSDIDVYNTDMALLHAIHHPSRTHDAIFCKLPDGSKEVLLVGAEDKKVSVYDIPEDPESAPKIIAVLVGHANR